MRVLVEGHKYRAADVRNVLCGIDALESVEGCVRIDYVGYFYNTKLQDCVFILPKVLLEDCNGRELVFGKYEPTDIVNIDANSLLTKKESDFIYEFAVWIYRAIVVFRNDRNNDTNIVFQKKIPEIGRMKKRLSNTFLDILLSLLQFNKDNRNFFFFILRNIHSGYNKINWTRTIGTTPAIVQQNCPIYLNPVNKKRKVNFDEELIVIFYSILNYISDRYGFPKEIDCNFQLITGTRFEAYLKGFGKTRLCQIKYKYYSDKAVELWTLCYAFFCNARQIQVNVDQREYLLVKDFNIVFEAIIDELIGDKNIPAGLKKQNDGKRVDHLYTYRGLTTNESDKSIYYIGDSKYYKLGSNIDRGNVYKQFTYARNVIQWNLNLFMSDDVEDTDLAADRKNFGGVEKIRDDMTEGYNVIPNFFISARLNKNLDYAASDITVTDRRNTSFENRHFNNRLFDRDTLLVCHYDVNFLYVVAMYARNNALQKRAWKEEVRSLFRSEIQKILKEKFQFYAMTSRPGIDTECYLKENFQDVLGKIYTPYSDKRIFSLALENTESESEGNERLLEKLRKSFFVEECVLGSAPIGIIEKVEAAGTVPLQNQRRKGVMMVMMEQFDAKSRNFITFGTIAVGIKSTVESMEIVKHIEDIGYILFHNWKDSGHHLYEVESVEIKVAADVAGVYKNISTVSIYVLVKFVSTELTDIEVNVKNYGAVPRELRYETLYTTIDKLV